MSREKYVRKRDFTTTREPGSGYPDTTSLERSPSKRKNKIYLDFLQNRRGQTIAAPYSARPKPGVMVSTPLDWKEVNEDLNLKKLYHI